MIRNHLRLTPLGSGGDVQLTQRVVQDNTPALSQAEFLRLATRHGWTTGREIKVLGVVPLVAATAAERQGLCLDDKRDLKRFLTDNPGFAVADPREI